MSAPRLKKLAYDESDLLVYIGAHYHSSADEGWTDWWLTELTWADGLITNVKKGQGSWTGRETAFP